MSGRSSKGFMLSVVTPAYREAENLPCLYERLRAVLDAEAPRWEWIVVDDHSPDTTPEVLDALAESEPRLRVIRLARNHGSYTAIACGLRYARGDAAVVISADLQDPPEVLADLTAAWRDGAEIVWAVRKKRTRDSWSQRLSAAFFHRLLRRLSGLSHLPAGGSDFFLLDRVVVRALRRCRERSVNLAALIGWMGFRQAGVRYDRGVRLHGRSGWNLGKKIRYAVDSVTAFSYLPIRLMSYVGMVVAVCGFAGAGYVVLRALEGTPVRGYPSLMAVVLVLGGLQMTMLGILGEYLWRTYDEVRGRPRFVIERTLRIGGDLEVNAFLSPSGSEDRRRPARVNAVIA